jgi:hypothetical protein
MNKILLALAFAIPLTFSNTALASTWFCSAHSSKNGAPFVWLDASQSVASSMVMQNCQYNGQSCIFDGCELR